MRVAPKRSQLAAIEKARVALAELAAVLREENGGELYEITYNSKQGTVIIHDIRTSPKK